MKCTTQVKFVGTCSLVAIAAALAFACLLPASPAYAVTAAEKAAEAESVMNELNAMQATLDEASNAYIQALTEYEAANTKAKEAQGRIDELKGEIADIQARLGDRARDMYRSGNTSFLDLLLGAASWDEFAQNWDLLNRMNENDAQLSAQAKVLFEKVKEEEAEYEKQAAIAEQKSKEASDKYHEAEALVQEMEATFNQLSAEAQELYLQEQAAAYAAYGANANGYVTEGGYVNDDGTVTDIQTGQVYESAGAYSAATGNAVVDRARAMIGSNYVWGGVGGSDGGFDCSGLVSYALTGSNTRLGTSYSFANYTRVSEPQAGDLYISPDLGHVAIYSGEGTLIHAIDESRGVAETTYDPSKGGFFVSAN